MGLFILRRVAMMIVTALCLTYIVFFMTNLYPNLEKLAKSQGNFRMSDAAVASYLGDRGYLEPTPIKYAQWLGLLPRPQTVRDDGSIVGNACAPASSRKTPRVVVCFRATGAFQPCPRNPWPMCLANASPIRAS